MRNDGWYQVHAKEIMAAKSATTVYNILQNFATEDSNAYYGSIGKKADRLTDALDKKLISPEEFVAQVKQLVKASNLTEQMGAAPGGGATTTATFQPAVNPDGSASKSGAFPGSALGYKKKKKENVIRRSFPTLKEALQSDRTYTWNEINTALMSMGMGPKNIMRVLDALRKTTNEAYTALKPSTKYQGTLVFNKKDIDSVANPKNSGVVTFTGINKKWGMNESKIGDVVTVNAGKHQNEEGEIIGYPKDMGNAYKIKFKDGSVAIIFAQDVQLKSEQGVPGAAKSGKGYHIAGAGTGGGRNMGYNEEENIQEAFDFNDRINGSSVKERRKK